MAGKKNKYQPPKQVEKQHEAEITEIGKKLKKLRESTGLSISAYSSHEKIKISRNSYAKMEKGEIYFSMENFLKVLEFHGVSISDFFSKDINDL